MGKYLLEITLIISCLLLLIMSYTHIIQILIDEWQAGFKKETFVCLAIIAIFIIIFLIIVLILYKLLNLFLL